MSELFLESLNPEQRLAVEHQQGPLLILAGAGSGKTTVLVNRSGRLIAVGGIAPAKICVLTFTNKAATELKARVASRLGERARGLTACTFHSLGLQMLRRFHREAKLPQGFGILDSGDAKSLIRELLANFHLSGKSDFDPEKLLSQMSTWRSRGQKHATTDFEYDICTEWLLPKYVRKLQLLGVVDFDDLIARPLELIAENNTIREAVATRFEQVMVDEFQDTNSTQMKFIDTLAQAHNNIVVVGDDDQAIYGWRGANVNHILEFPHHYQGCQVIRLERNYRSSATILELANTVIQNNTTRHGKTLRPQTQSDQRRLPELFTFETEEEEAEGIVSDLITLKSEGYQFKDFAVLYRANGQGALIEATLRLQQIPYRLSGGTAFFDRRETKDLLAYLRCALKPHEVAYRRIINTPLRGIGETSLDKIGHFAEQTHISFFEAAQRWSEIGVQPAIGERINDFHRRLETFADELLAVKIGQTVGERLVEMATEMGYREFVYAQSRDPQVGAKRWLGIEVFSRILTSFVDHGGLNKKSLMEFVDAMELRDVGDKDASEENADKVQLLTLHACKGLEFPVVYLIGIEENLLPHRTLGTDIDEERRLFYVGITRAKQRLILSHARNRKLYGRLSPSSPSRFLLEIPGPLVQSFEGGVRPCSGENRRSMLADLYRKLDQQEKFT